ncbi:hypothetical protein L0668_09445 [Paraglaciecola aquimarina]|uniref:Uncharacterized protein n=1 Tax=Paraglaciecola algarum TaxID=3050085 RepID=A0ABS9D5Y3_9ALTE|nr:hypothetical protein [Paraglaciecola sp. G1-23]MCF2948329.1 hypothetical protein [Paraglaciecola sp. G1-23]
MKKIMCIVSCIFVCSAALVNSAKAFAQEGGWGYKNNRIAVSADGNEQPDMEYVGKYRTADPDDWGATPAALAMLAKLKKQSNLVHYSYNNFMPSPPHTTIRNYMQEGIDGSISRWGFNRDIFFDVGIHKQKAVTHLKNEIAKSTAADPLYFINMGPSEFLYQAVKLTVEQGQKDALSHVYVISHSNYNDNHLRRPEHKTIDDVLAFSNNKINFNRIKDQNDRNNPNKGWSSAGKVSKDWSVWEWMKDHKDPDVNWLWESMKKHKHNKPDISDAGMVFYLLTGDADGNPEKFKQFIGTSIQ